MKSILYIATTAAWAVSSATAGFAQRSLPDLEAGFALESAQLDEPHLAFDAKYRDHLETLNSSYRKAGNLKGMLAVEEEIKGFTGKTEPSESAELKRLQDICQSRRTALEVQRQGVYLRLLGRYRAKAESLAAAPTKTAIRRVNDPKVQARLWRDHARALPVSSRRSTKRGRLLCHSPIRSR